MATPAPKPAAPAAKPAAPAAPAAVKPPVEEAIEEGAEDSGPIVERITIGSLVVNKTVYDDGDMEMTEVKTLKAGPDEKFKSWRHAQPA